MQTHTQTNEEEWYCDDCGKIIPTGHDECSCWSDPRRWKCDDCDRGLFEDDECPCWGAPERPMTAYQLFMDVRKTMLSNKHPNWKAGLIRQQAHEKWTTSPAEKKERYEALALDDKHRYEKEMRVYNKKLKAFDDRQLQRLNREEKEREEKRRKESERKERSTTKIVVTHQVDEEDDDKDEEYTTCKQLLRAGIRQATHRQNVQRALTSEGDEDEDEDELIRQATHRQNVQRALTSEGDEEEEEDDEEDEDEDDEEEEDEDEDEEEFRCAYCHILKPVSEVAYPEKELDEECEDETSLVCNKCVDD